MFGLTRQSGRIFRLGLEVCRAVMFEWEKRLWCCEWLRKGTFNLLAYSIHLIDCQGELQTHPERTYGSKFIHFAQYAGGLISLSRFYCFVFYMHMVILPCFPYMYILIVILLLMAYPVVHWLNFILFCIAWCHCTSFCVPNLMHLIHFFLSLPLSPKEHRAVNRVLWSGHKSLYSNHYISAIFALSLSW